MDPTRKGWLCLGLLFWVSPRYKSHICLRSVRPEGLLAQSIEALGNTLSLQPREAGDIFTRNFPDWADKEIEAAGKYGVAIVTLEDAGYPGRLKNLPDPPPFLYVRGRIEPEDAAAVAVVGSRRATSYGLRVAERIGGGLAEAGLTVVSGMARGIDTAAHRGAMASGGRTIGVLGSGIDVVYPKENRRMFERVAESGALVSEFPFGAPPQAHHFPIRNRIISGLSSAVVVVEAARDSGSLITARLAADELGLPVCAVPGPITSPTSEGCNDLIYDGAPPVRYVQDVVEELPAPVRRLAEENRSRRAPSQVSGDRGTAAAARLKRETRRVLNHLRHDEPRGADDLAASMGVAVSVLLAHLLELEILGLAAQLPGGLYIRKT